ncbi:MAG TPA: hypothetical protein EYP35_00825 [Desulfobacterales bacterium]|nr:hypothetical protein [Desulfobacterales bacterium]
MSNCNHCGADIKTGMKFCGQCGKPSSVQSFCPGCGATVPAGNFCGQCGIDIRGVAEKSQELVGGWDRGEDNFATKVPEAVINAGAKDGFEVRHGSKALFFEQGKLVEIAESGRYTTSEGGFLAKLFGKKRKLSAVLVDGGDVVLPFTMDGVKTADNLFVGVQADVVLRLEDPNAFFINVMKEKADFKNHELRAMLFGEVENAIQEAVAGLAFAELTSKQTAKDELASRLEMHLRTTFGRSGFDFGQVRSISFNEKTLDASAKKAAESEAEARAIEAEGRGEFRTGRASQGADELGRELRKGEQAGARKDIDLDGESNDIALQRRLQQGDQQISEKHQDADFIEKRLEVYRKLKSSDVFKIKTDEEFRKFQLEIDRDQTLDEVEWKEFKKEILWKDTDRELDRNDTIRDRNFLDNKIAIQQQFDLERIAILNNGQLTIEKRQQELKLVDILQDAKLQAVEKMGEVEKARARAELAQKEIKELGEKELKNQSSLKDLELRKAQVKQGLEEEQDKALVKHEIAKLELEEKKLKSEMGMANLEKMKAMKRADEMARDLHRLEIEQRQDESRLKRETEDHRMKLDEMKTAGQLENERLKAMSELSIEQLISVSGQNQAAVLGDLAKSQTLKGMSAEEIMAMNDPAALGKALEERARSAQNDETKALYERMVSQMDASSDKVAAAHEESADRTERMFSQGMQAMSGQQHGAVDAERAAADRMERMSGRAMDQMGSVAATRARPGEGVSAVAQTGTSKVQVCSKCKQEVDSAENFCPNCGNKMY